MRGGIVVKQWTRTVRAGLMTLTFSYSAVKLWSGSQDLSPSTLGSSKFLPLYSSELSAGLVDRFALQPDSSVQPTYFISPFLFVRDFLHFNLHTSILCIAWASHLPWKLFRPYQPTEISCPLSLIKLIFYASHLAHNYIFPNFAS